MQTGQLLLPAIHLGLVVPAHLARTACAPDWLHAPSISNLDVFHVRSYLHDHPRAFMAGRPHAAVAHLAHPQIVQHVMDVGVAKAGDVELE